jgi:O-glycosyl hydrolase
MLPGWRRLGGLLLAVAGSLLSAPAVVALPARAATTGPEVSAWLTTPDQSQLLAKQPGLSFGLGSGTRPVLDINENDRYQRMEGFGAAMTDSSAYLISQLTLPARSALMSALFSPSGGEISFLRLPMGASDMVVPWQAPGGTSSPYYSYDDPPCAANAASTDPALACFSIAHDEKYIIPVLQQARALEPGLKIIAAPWSAPGWMKDNGSMVGSSSGTQSTLLPQYYGVYANYFVRFVQAYEADGVRIDAVSIQNEPQNVPSGYPGMRLTSSQEATFAPMLRAALDGAGFASVKIIGFDHNWGGANQFESFTYGKELLSDPAAAPSVAGIAFHCYGGQPDYMSRLHEAYPNAAIYFTECTAFGPFVNSTPVCGPDNWAADFGWDMQHLIIGNTRNWANSVIKWNLALDNACGPKAGGCQNCLGLLTIDSTDQATSQALDSGQVSAGANLALSVTGYQHDYYSVGHISRFVQPGAYRISSTELSTQGLPNVAFKNPDGSKVLIVYNSSGQTQAFTVRWGGKTFSYSLPSGAAVTFTWTGSQASLSGPTPPSNLAADTTASDGKVALHWDFSPLAVFYNVYRAFSATGPFKAIATGVDTPSYTDTSVTNGTTYYYRVTAVNLLGESGPSATAAETPTLVLQAAAADTESNLALENCSDPGDAGVQPSLSCTATNDDYLGYAKNGGDDDVGWADNGDWIGWNRVNFGAGGYSHVTVRVASGSNGGTLEFHLGSPTGTLIASVPVLGSGGWQSWTTVKNIPLTANVTGLQTVYAVYTSPASGGIANLHWIQFS